jgi:hypothetical protein
MPEVLTKYPDVVIKVLEGAGVRCGPGQTQKILTKCPPARFCSTPAGETCVYGLGEVTSMTQIERGELAKLVCPAKAGGCAFGMAPPATSALALGCALVVGMGFALRRRFRRRSQVPMGWRRKGRPMGRR